VTIVWIKIIAVLAAIPIGLLILDLLLRWMEGRDWIYYKRKRPTSSTRSVFNAFQEFYDPEIRHVQEEQRNRAAENAGQKDDSDR